MHRHLNDWRQRIELRGSWIAPLSLAVSLLATLLTTDFKDRFNIPKEYWSALFFVCFVAAVFWLVRSIKNSIWNHPESPEQIIEKLKNGASGEKVGSSAIKEDRRSS
jgi:hypothetical protein